MDYLTLKIDTNISYKTRKTRQERKQEKQKQTINGKLSTMLYQTNRLRIETLHDGKYRKVDTAYK